MAIHRSLVIFAIVALLAPTISLATDFIVGGDDGWKRTGDYVNWAKDKQFIVGDTLVFKYTAGEHNVFKVTGDEFKNCIVPTNNSLGFFTGNDAIKLAAPGMKWYICGKQGHCTDGQKLKINVLSSAPAPAPSAASTLLATNFQIFLGMLFAIAALIVV